MTGETATFKRRKTAAMKGLPYVKVKQNVNQKHYMVKLPLLPEMTYEQFLWLLFSATNVVVLSILYPYMKLESFGSNFVYIISVYGMCYSLDLLTVLFQYATGTAQPRQLRISGFFDELCGCYYTMLLAVTSHSISAHMAINVMRDVSMSSFGDLTRIYFWPDNEHNRKRVANFQNLVEKYGLSVWVQQFKTPFVRGILSYLSVEWFTTPDEELSLVRLVTFPLKVIVYELVADFIYYWMHRYLHENKWLYKHVHKLHHECKCPTALGASTMTIAECAATFTITEIITPFILARFIPLSVTEYGLFTSWLVAIEVYGHSGHVLEVEEPSNWRLGLSGLLTTLGIQLETKDHELHHWNNDFNYCKRTQAWDKLFGTYDYDNKEKAAEACLETKRPEKAPRKNSQ